MQVFKFGGASVKNASAVKNVVGILRQNETAHKLVVVSAMGKTTNALERIVDLYCRRDPVLSASVHDLKSFHHNIADQLFDGAAKTATLDKIDCVFEEMNAFFKRNKSPQHDFVYDQIIPFGELLSTTIISAYLEADNIAHNFIDARDVVKTNSTYRDARVDWDKTNRLIKAEVKPGKLNLTQGFIASDVHNFSTTLGREGSDYSAGIFAYCLDARALTIWKDVDGVLNADPAVFNNTVLLHQISYEEAIELAFYGASVIHPKTIQPIKRKNIPLFVKAFNNPQGSGTKVCDGRDIEPQTPCYIVKHHLNLISLASRDFSFFVEENMSEVFALFHRYQTKVDLIQNSAISFSVCINDLFGNFDDLLIELKKKFSVKYRRDVSLYTIRYFDQGSINQIERGRETLLKQTTRKTVQIVTATE